MRYKILPLPQKVERIWYLVMKISLNNTISCFQQAENLVVTN